MKQQRVLCSIQKWLKFQNVCSPPSAYSPTVCVDELFSFFFFFYRYLSGLRSVSTCTPFGFQPNSQQPIRTKLIHIHVNQSFLMMLVSDSFDFKFEKCLKKTGGKLWIGGKEGGHNGTKEQTLIIYLCPGNITIIQT